MKLSLYHTGFEIIKEPDVRHGRSNADFGQGFYMSGDQDFSRRWARERRGHSTYINFYELETEGLQILEFTRDLKWFSYIYQNRAGGKDLYPEADVIIGPIANDTIYDTFGITTSGFLKKEQALQLLMIGPVYEQIVLKTEKAAKQLTWLSAEQLTPEEIAGYREIVAEEEAAYQKEFARIMDETDETEGQV